jgi:hypothetical protein
MRMKSGNMLGKWLRNNESEVLVLRSIVKD